MPLALALWRAKQPLARSISRLRDGLETVANEHIGDLDIPLWLLLCRGSPGDR
jgi:hypothetical protein